MALLSFSQTVLGSSGWLPGSLQSEAGQQPQLKVEAAYLYALHAGLNPWHANIWSLSLLGMDEISIHSRVMGINKLQLLSAGTKQHVLLVGANLTSFSSQHDTQMSESAHPQVVKPVTSSRFTFFHKREEWRQMSLTIGVAV